MIYKAKPNEVNGSSHYVCFSKASWSVFISNKQKLHLIIWGNPFLRCNHSRDLFISTFKETIHCARYLVYSHSIFVRYPIKSFLFWTQRVGSPGKKRIKNSLWIPDKSSWGTHFVTPKRSRLRKNHFNAALSMPDLLSTPLKVKSVSVQTNKDLSTKS